MPQPPRNDGWKHAAKPNPAKPPSANPAPNTSRKQWQPGAPKPKTTAKKTSRAVKFVAAGVGVGLLTAVVVIVILLLQPPKYAHLVVVTPDTDTLALSENRAGVNGGKEIVDWGNGDAKSKAENAADRDAWKAKLNTNAPGLVLYFAAHAGADADGPYLWMPPKAGAVSKDDKLYVKDILQRLAEVKGKPKLLVFDLAQTPANWVFGGAYSDFPGALKRMGAEIERDPELAVICSADEGQVSWVAEERRKSVFGYHFVEGVRGAAGSPNNKLTAADLFTHVEKEVQKWAVANRGTSQKPILLPEKTGKEGAQKVELATLPPTPYVEPAKFSPPVPPVPLLDEWKQAEGLATLSPSPDTTDPLKWREYLEYLMRWERLVRLDGVPDSLPNTVRGLRDELKKNTVADVTSAPVALPAGRALAGGSDALKGVAFDPLWVLLDQTDEKDRAEAVKKIEKAWEKLRTDNPGRENTLRIAAAKFVVDKVLAAGVSQTTLFTAETVLDTVGGQVQPVEAHYLRMLYRHLPADPKLRTVAELRQRTEADLKLWPPADLLARAVKLRRTAEEAAWANGQVYPEQVFRWTRPLVTAADDARQTGEDELFDTPPFTAKPDSWKDAAAKFQEAEAKYEQAKGRAAVVADALARRDRVFARFPYYARWVAARGGPKNADELLLKLNKAAAAAHEIDRLCGQLPFAPSEDNLPGRLAELQKQSDAAALLDEVAKAYSDKANQLTDAALDANWHELDAAQGVPFRPTEAGRDLGQLARTVAANLAAKSQQPDAVKEVVPDLWDAASKNLRSAAAYLNDPSLAQNMDGGRPAGEDWGKQPRNLAEKLAGDLRGLPGRAAEGMVKADAPGTQLSEVSDKYAEAARFARLTDPAAPAGGAPTPPDADRRYWRHYLLLRQAERITRDGWCSLQQDETNTEVWYCAKAAALVRTAAGDELTALVPGRENKSPEQKARLVRDWEAERNRKPTVLQVAAAPTRVVVPNERRVEHQYDLTATQGERVGYPVTEYRLPEQLKATRGGRLLETRLEGKKVGTTVDSTPERFALAGRSGAGTLEATVRYRGRLYTGPTAVTFTGPPNLEVKNTPPSGPAAMALQAHPDAVAGAVTILIDITTSMRDPVAPGRKRIDEAYDGVEMLLRDTIPEGTKVIIGTFVGAQPGGRGTKFVLEVKPLVEEFKLNKSAVQLKDTMDQVKKLQIPDDSITPIAGAIDYALNSKEGKKALWPKEYSGGRTLVVITDGDDNWNSGEYPTTGYQYSGPPGEVLTDAIKTAVADENAPDVNVFLSLFAMEKDPDGLKNAKKQFKDVQDGLKSNDRGRFKLLAETKDAKALAESLKDAVMPRVRYKEQDGKAWRVLEATSPSGAKGLTYRPSEPLDVSANGTLFDLRGLGTQSVQLTPGGRMLIRAKRDGEKVILTRPAFAYELATAPTDRDGDPRPNATSGKLDVTLPRLAFIPRGGGQSELSAVLTMEEPDTATDQNFLKASSRQYAWIDVANADGTPLDPLAQSVRVSNHLEAGGYELLAPAWDVTVTGTFKDANGRNFRRPTLTAFWGNGWPESTLASQKNKTAVAVRLQQDAGGEPVLKSFDFANGKVAVLDAAVQDEKDGSYLRVWMATPADGPRVYLHVEGWGAVGERHSYFDRHGRYTAEFGPLTAKDLEANVSFVLYSVDELRKHAAKDQRQVELPGDAGTERDLPPRLSMQPKK